MKRIALPALTALLAACSGGLSIPVDDIVLDATNTGNLVCYVEVADSAPLRFSSASYRADATYTNTAEIGSDEIEIVIYGRSEEPAQRCLDEAAAGGIRLSEPIRLSDDETRPIVVGEGFYGEELAALVTEDRYWIGAKVSDNYALGGSETIELTGGRVRVQF